MVKINFKKERTVYMPKRGENIRKRKDGRWEGRFICGYKKDGKAKYRSVYGTFYLETKRKLLQATEECKADSPSKSCGNTYFREVLFHWLRNRKTKLRIQTYNKYSTLIENHLAESIGAKKINKIDCTILNHFIEQKLREGRLDGQGSLSTNYTRTLVFIIRSAIDFATLQNYCHPIKGDIGKLPKEKLLLPIFTRGEQNQLENYIRKEMDSAKLGVLLSLNTGLRIGEAYVKQKLKNSEKNFFLYRFQNRTCEFSRCGFAFILPKSPMPPK